MALPPEQEASYSAIIDSILAASDLNTISAKRIRKGLQAAITYDIAPQKDAINDLIMQRFDKMNGERQAAELGEPIEPAPTATIEKTAATNGVHHSPKKRATTEEESELSDVADSPPPKKRHKKTKSVEEDDAAFAARLQAEENRAARATRGGATTKKRAPVQKKTPKKKKSAKKVKDEDDSDLESGSSAEKKEVKRSGGFHKPMILSTPLSELLGETQLSRPQTVKKIWEYVKERDLQDPNDKRQIRCDEAMRAVFKTDRVHMFTMNKILNQNLYAMDE